MTAIIRAPRPPKGWTEIPDSTIRDARLSYRARGILARLLSNTDGYRMTAQDLANESPDGRHSVLAGLRELKAAGYLVTCCKRDSKGRLRTETYVFDFPQNTVDKNVQNTGVGLPDAGPPDVGQTNSFQVNQTGIPEAAAPRTRTRTRAHAREDPPAPEGGGAAAAQQQRGKARRRRPSGIVTWDAADIEEAERLEQRYDAAVIADVSERLKNQGLEPVPGRVEKELERLERARAAAAAAERRAAAAHAAASPPIDPDAAAKGREFISKIRARRREHEAVL